YFSGASRRSRKHNFREPVEVQCLETRLPMKNSKLVIFLSCFFAATLTAPLVTAAAHGSGGHSFAGRPGMGMPGRPGMGMPGRPGMGMRGGVNRHGGDFHHHDDHFDHHHHDGHPNHVHNRVVFIGGFGFPWWWGWGWGPWWGWGYPYGY